MKITDLKVGKIVKTKSSGIVGKICCFMTIPVDKFENGKKTIGIETIVWFRDKRDIIFFGSLKDLECVEDEQHGDNVNKIEIIFNGKTTIAKASNGKTGIAKCNPKDKYDKLIGASMAIDRVLNDYEIHLVDKVTRDKIYKLMGLEKNKPFYLTDVLEKFKNREVIKRTVYIINDEGELVYYDGGKWTYNIGLGQLLSGLVGYCYVNATEKGQSNKLTDSKI